MPEYRRFIAYFYEYIDGKKQKNAGFAKVELRNGMWRILFRLTPEVMPEPPMQVYGFVRTGEYLLGVPMGTIRSDREVAEEWAYYAETPVGKSSYRLEDFAGIRVASGDGRCFLTVWDDEPVQPERFVLELPKEKGPGGAAEMAPRDEITPEETGEVIAGEAREAAAGETMPEETGEVIAGEAREAAVGETMPEEAGEVIAGVAREAVAGETMPEEAGEVIAGVAREAAAGETMPEEAGEISARGTAQREEQEASGGQIMHAAEKEQGKLECERESSDGIKELFKMRSRFQPFADTEITNCVMIMPCDVIRLQQENWQVGRSSFLQHGFYQHRHLLLGTMGGGEYVIGVPGIRTSQEQYMAGMFGFDHFKISRTCECGKVFGYWYRVLEKMPVKSEESCGPATKYFG